MNYHYYRDNLLKGHWTVVENFQEYTLIRQSAAELRGIIVGSIFIGSFGATLIFEFVDKRALVPLLPCFIVWSLWKIHKEFWARRHTLIICHEGCNLMTSSIRGKIGEMLQTTQVHFLEVRENEWKGRDVDRLCQIYVLRNDSDIPMLIYQQYFRRKEQVLLMAEELANCWQVELLNRL